LLILKVKAKEVVVAEEEVDHNLSLIFHHPFFISNINLVVEDNTLC
jgi:hypothetical protein